MNKKLWFFRNIVANIVIIAVLSLTVVYLYLDDSAPVSQGSPIRRGNSAQNVSLMVNVSFGTEYIDGMLRIFKDNDIKTTFFVAGMWAAEHNEALKAIYAAGMEIGNHGYFNKEHKKLSQERSREEIELTHRLVQGILGCEMKFFAPPSGSFSKNTVKIAKELGYTTVLWSRDAADISGKTRDSIVLAATKDIGGGELIRIHPSASSVAALPEIIRIIKSAGLKITPVSEVIGL
ncbi:MAG: polysaccharide deacetylase family protein [Firmicutes bacterium]|nr:polysaccharide deacetylase family protein [Bacillota bacterium]